MSEYEDVCPDKEDLLERDKRFADLINKYSCCEEEDEDGYEIDDLIAMYDIIDEENERFYPEEEECEEVSPDEDEIEASINNQLVPFHQQKEEDQYKNLTSLFGKDYVDNMKKAFLKRSLEAESLNLQFWKRSKSTEKFHEQTLKTKDFEASSRQYERSHIEEGPGSSSMLTFVQPPATPNGPVNGFKIPHLPNFNASSVPSFSIPHFPNVSYNTIPMPQVPGVAGGSNQQMYNFRVREVYYDYFSLTGNESHQFLPYNISLPVNSPNLSRAITNFTVPNTDSNDQLKAGTSERNLEPQKTKPAKKEDKTSSKKKKDSVKQSSSKHGNYCETQKSEESEKKISSLTKSSKEENQPKISPPSQSLNQNSSTKLPMSYSECVKLKPQKEEKLKVTKDPTKIQKDLAPKKESKENLVQRNEKVESKSRDIKQPKLTEDRDSDKMSKKNKIKKENEQPTKGLKSETTVVPKPEVSKPLNPLENISGSKTKSTTNTTVWCSSDDDDDYFVRKNRENAQKLEAEKMQQTARDDRKEETHKKQHKTTESPRSKIDGKEHRNKHKKHGKKESSKSSQSEKTATVPKVTDKKIMIENKTKCDSKATSQKIMSERDTTVDDDEFFKKAAQKYSEEIKQRRVEKKEDTAKIMLNENQDKKVDKKAEELINKEQPKDIKSPKATSGNKKHKSNHKKHDKKENELPTKSSANLVVKLERITVPNLEELNIAKSSTKLDEKGASDCDSIMDDDEFFKMAAKKYSEEIKRRREEREAKNLKN